MRSPVSVSRWLPAALCGLVLAAAGSRVSGQSADAFRSATSRDVRDLSVPVATTVPAAWPGGSPYYQMILYRPHGPGASASDWTFIDEHTGTQFDAPAHFVPPPGSGLPNAGPMGVVTGDRVPVHQFVGEACVIDVRALLDDAEKGRSPVIRTEVVQTWERANRPLGPGDVVLFRSGYVDRYYQPLPAGNRLVAEPLAGTAVGWPAPDPACMRYLAERGVWAAGIDSPSMGPLPDLAADTHVAGLEKGMIWTEMLTNLGGVPTTGAFYAFLGPKHANSSGSEGRGLAVVNREAAAPLIRAARGKNVVDLSATLAENLPCWWPGRGPGDYAQQYISILLHTFDQPGGPYFARGHILDSHAGTHVDPPAHFLPPPGFDNDRYSGTVRAWLREYEKSYGPRGTSDITTEKIPLEQMMGPARVVDVTRLVGTTSKDDWPASPKITVEHIQADENRHGLIRRGDVVLFRSGHVDRYYRPFPEGDKCSADPLAGRSEGWPAPTPEAILYLARRGVRCIGTDGSSMGSVVKKDGTFTHWAGAGQNVVFVEFLMNLDKLPARGAYFMFGPIKQVGGHGGIGRALALLPDR